MIPHETLTPELLCEIFDIKKYPFIELDINRDDLDQYGDVPLNKLTKAQQKRVTEWFNNHTPGGSSCGDTTTYDGRCVNVVDGDYGQPASANCTCPCHEEE